MNWAHLQAFIWLRWRLTMNQWRRAGALSAALMVLVSIGAVTTAIPLFLGTFALGVFAIPKASPAQLMYVWDGLIFFFLLFWGIGLMTELQRNDPLSLSKFLHLPVSVKSAFLINYLSSLVRLSLLTFLPIMAAFALALVYVKGVSQLAVLPSLAAFLLMITAPTYQFQGWLASLMSNPRLRRTVVVVTTMAFVLVFQLPNLLNLYAPRQAQRMVARSNAQTAELAKLQQAYAAKDFDIQEYSRRMNEVIERNKTEGQRESQEEHGRSERIVRNLNMVLPFGWLPIGVMYASEGQFAPSLLGLAGMTLIGTASLWRAYRSTLGQYQGQVTNRKGRVPVERPRSMETQPKGRLLETRLPGLSEPVSAIALGGFQSLLRSPEAKISLLTPLIMGAVFGSMLLRGSSNFPLSLRPLLGIGSIAFVLFGLLQLMGNQFGIDRDGFRVFVLCAAPRRDILLGKNLAYAPAAFLLSTILLVAVQIICPMRFDHALSMAPQFLSMFLLFSLMANLFSIYAPVFIAAGSLKPANPKMSTIFLQLAMFLVLFPICQGTTLLPLGIELVLKAYGWADRVPVCLLLSLVECIGVFFLYRVALDWLGGRLQAREQKILETVTNRAL